jgi:hypothetical protein
MLKLENVEELVRWIVNHYEVLPLEDEDPLLIELQRVERRAQLQEPRAVVIVLRKKANAPDDPIPV